jgi:GDP-L-fucose synthase
MIKVCVIGHSGFLGRAVIDQFNKCDIDVIGVSKSHGVDATDERQLEDVITSDGITTVVNLAAACGGIGLNQIRPAELWSTTNNINGAVLKACSKTNVRLLMIGTACSYGSLTPTPFREDDLMKYGYPEATNAAYGVSKLNGLFGSMAYRQQYDCKITYAIPANLYGPFDNFDLGTSHVIPALIRKIDEAKTAGTPLVVWGTGIASREFLYVRDCAKAITQLSIMPYEMVGLGPYNIGNGQEVAIADLVKALCNAMDFKGEVIWDSSKPDGQLRRCLDVSKLHKLGFAAETALAEGLLNTIKYYQRMVKNGSGSTSNN